MNKEIMQKSGYFLFDQKENNKQPLPQKMNKGIESLVQKNKAPNYECFTYKLINE